MCDIYMHKCKKCKVEIDMHLADFDTGQSEIDVYCANHIPTNVEEGVVWEYGDTKKMGETVFIHSKTENAKDNWEGNHPNYLHLKAVSVFKKTPYPKGKIIKPA